MSRSNPDRQLPPDTPIAPRRTFGDPTPEPKTGRKIRGSEATGRSPRRRAEQAPAGYKGPVKQKPRGHDPACRCKKCNAAGAPEVKKTGWWRS